MLRLDSYIGVEGIKDILEYTRIRFKDANKYITPEAMAVAEQRFLDKETLRRLCSEQVGVNLVEPIPSYMPEEIINAFIGSGLVPVVYNPMDNIVDCVYLPKEVDVSTKPEIPGHVINLIPTTLHYYFNQYQKKFGKHPELLDLPPKMLFDMVAQEGINLDAADMTISSNDGKTASIYYNVRKKKIFSNRVVPSYMIPDMISYICIKSPYDFTSRDPKYADIDINKDYRGRVVINKIMTGHVITIRFLPNSNFNSSMESLNLSPDAIDWMRNKMFDGENGLRLFVGATYSGKNTSALAGLREIVNLGIYKIVSVEVNVEMRLPGVEQINTKTSEEFKNNVQSLIHQNPDFVYITEIRDAIGLDVIHIANTGKRVLSTLHANGVADTLSRLKDVTKLDFDQILQVLHSVCFQALVRNEEEDRVYPKVRFLRFTDDLKYRLYGKSLGEIIKIIKDEEGGDTWM